MSLFNSCPYEHEVGHVRTIDRPSLKGETVPQPLRPNSFCFSSWCSAVVGGDCFLEADDLCSLKRHIFV